MRVQSLGQKDPLEQEMATCSSILAGKESACKARDPGQMPWTEEPGRYSA